MTKINFKSIVEDWKDKWRDENMFGHTFPDEARENYDKHIHHSNMLRGFHPQEELGQPRVHPVLHRLQSTLSDLHQGAADNRHDAWNHYARGHSRRARESEKRAASFETKLRGIYHRIHKFNESLKT